MDTSKQYIKMSDCPEIQEQWIPEDGDFYVPYGKDYISGYGPVDTVSGVRVIKEDKRREYLTGGIYDGLIWLPRQDQIQEMMDIFMIKEKNMRGVWAMEQYFHEWFLNKAKIETYTTREQLWLAFYMLEKYGKTWDGKDWNKIKQDKAKEN